MDLSNMNRLKKFFKNGVRIEDLCNTLGITTIELNGILSILNLEEEVYSISIENDEPVILKSPNYKRMVKAKDSMDKLIHTRICVISDTHLGSKEQQLSKINEIYIEAKNRNIDTILHIGDVLDGDYHRVRPEHQYQIFLHGFTEQTDYAIEMYPRVEGITTYFITGSHDDTHIKNGGAFPGERISDARDDMVYLGQDEALFYKNNIKMLLKHPGGGTSKYLSTKPQNIIDSLESGNKPNIAFMGHYHKSHYMVYRNIHNFLVPCLVGKTQFMSKMSLDNIVGAYFIDIYSTKRGEVQYIDFEEYLFDSKEYDETDYKKCKKLDI